jgi:large subunit ribosomal protein L7/L12
MTPRSLVQSSRVSPSVRMMSAQSLPFPEGENTPTESKQYPEKIVQIVDHISQLTLLEVADLNELLKARLKITDAPVMMAGNFGGGGPGAAAAAPAPEEEEEAAPAVAVQVLEEFLTFF